MTVFHSNFPITTSGNLMASTDTYKSFYLLVRLRLITSVFLLLRDVLTNVPIHQAILMWQQRLACSEVDFGGTWATCIPQNVLPQWAALHQEPGFQNQMIGSWLGLQPKLPGGRGFDLPQIHWDSWNFMGRWQGFREPNANGCWLFNSNSNWKALPAHKKKTLACKSGNVDFLIWMD